MAETSLDGIKALRRMLSGQEDEPVEVPTSIVDLHTGDPGANGGHHGHPHPPPPQQQAARQVSTDEVLAEIRRRNPQIVELAVATVALRHAEAELAAEHRKADTLQQALLEARTDIDERLADETQDGA